MLPVRLPAAAGGPRLPWLQRGATGASPDSEVTRLANGLEKTRRLCRPSMAWDRARATHPASALSGRPVVTSVTLGEWPWPAFQFMILEEADRQWVALTGGTGATTVMAVVTVTADIHTLPALPGFVTPSSGQPCLSLPV